MKHYAPSAIALSPLNIESTPNCAVARSNVGTVDCYRVLHKTTHTHPPATFQAGFLEIKTGAGNGNDTRATIEEAFLG